MYFQNKFHVNIDICFFCENPNCACKPNNFVRCFCKTQNLRIENILEHLNASRKCFLNFHCSSIKFRPVKIDLKTKQKKDLITLNSENHFCLQISANDLSSYLTFILKLNRSIKFFFGGKNFQSVLKNEKNICIVDFRSIDFKIYLKFLNKKLILLYLI